MVNDPGSSGRLVGSGGRVRTTAAAVRLVLALGGAVAVAACSSTAERPVSEYTSADVAVSSAQGPIRSPAAERVVGGIVDMVLSQRLVSTIDEARKHPAGVVRDGQPLYLYIQSKRPLGELAHPADPYSKHSFSSHPHLFVQIGDNISMRILNTCYVTLTEAEARGHALVVPLAPLSKRVGDVPSDCWLETVTQADPVRQRLEVRLAGFPGRFESWLPVPDLLGVEAVDVDLRRGAGTYAGMLRADPKPAPALVSTLGGAAAGRAADADSARAIEASRREAMKVAEEARKAKEKEQADALARQAREQKAREQAEAARVAEEARLREQAEAARLAEEKRLREAAEQKRLREQQAEAARLAEQERVRQQAEEALAARRAREQSEAGRQLAGAGGAVATGAAAAVTGVAGSTAKAAAAVGAVPKGASTGQGVADGEPAASARKPASSPADSARAAAQQAQAAALASRRMLEALPAGARLSPVTPLLPAKPRNVGGTRMAVQLRSLTATLLGRQPSETYFTDRNWQTQPGKRSRRDARQTIHAIAIFRGEECSWQSLLVSRRPNASTIAEVAADGDEVPIACPDLDR